jgi:hypothetical protein
MEPWRAMDAQIGFLKAQNEAAERLDQRPLISITLMRSWIRIRITGKVGSGFIKKEGFAFALQ